MDDSAPFDQWVDSHMPRQSFDSEPTSTQEKMRAAFEGGRSVAGRCATCRWAEMRQTGASLEQELHCEKVEESDSLAQLESPVDGGLVVAPLFGCIQWEAKPDA